MLPKDASDRSYPLYLESYRTYPVSWIHFRCTASEIEVTRPSQPSSIRYLQHLTLSMPQSISRHLRVKLNFLISKPILLPKYLHSKHIKVKILEIFVMLQDIRKNTVFGVINPFEMSSNPSSAGGAHWAV